MYWVACGAVFAAAYLLNVLTITVGYHRGLAHGGVQLSPLLRRALLTCGNWITGLDPKAWVVMHRLHHESSDTPEDPHSPVNVGILGIPYEQLKSYKRVLKGLLKRQRKLERLAGDLDFPLSALNRKGWWYVPYLLHAGIAVALGAWVGPLLGAAYFFGMVSHPVQGGLVNALGHAVGGRNFNTPDNSRNNLLVAWLILGEGFQNNHHRYPSSAKFSYARHEVDLGFAACLLLERVGLLRVRREALIPRPAASVELEAEPSATA